MAAGQSNLLTSLRATCRRRHLFFTYELWAAVVVLGAVLAWLLVPL